ncbi:Transcription elongation factor GreA [Koleobacter methoxysyntrophicus]|uniref:Transcription elongation factor GreA n=1 Tax=Koleobacter methoxysyntrophicus TaxID=2751313 RepID=A0A8A0RMV8_9FIRM|nr:transcription elongation factor GreA [Koleobacter methoxysyntrophicus]QSQ08859.1 Transcription elongation factor GreA [Koleobacter methoxysyntrophicus]
MVNKEVILTPEGLKKLEAELEYLKTVKRREVALKIKQAISFGDISENSEYEEAKNEQAFIEGRIATLEKMLRNAKIIDDMDIGTDVVSIGSRVRVQDMELGDEFVYTIVGSAEADPANYKISNESPVGKALLGKTVNSIVEIDVPAGVIRYKILEITK